MGTSHLKLIWVRDLIPHILQHHIPEHPIDSELIPKDLEAVAQGPFTRAPSAHAFDARMRVYACTRAQPPSSKKPPPIFCPIFGPIFGAEDRRWRARGTLACRRQRYKQGDSGLSCTRRGIGRQGIGSLCKQFLSFSTMPCRHMPLLVHFRSGYAASCLAPDREPRRAKEMAHREFPGKFESSSLSRDNLSREIGRRLRAAESQGDPEFNGSVRFGRFGLVAYSFLYI